MADGTTVLAAAVGLATAGGAVAWLRRWSCRRAVLGRAGLRVALARAQPDRPRSRRGAGRPRPVGADAVATLPEVVDLLAVAAASGLPAGAALVAVGPRVPEPWRSAVLECVGRAEHGLLLTDALDHLPDAVGDPARPVVAVLRAGLADGGPLAADLARLAADARDLRRRRAEERARRIPVRLLLPLVCCSLPAFAVLSIVPIVAGVLDGLRFPSVPS